MTAAVDLYEWLRKVAGEDDAEPEPRRPRPDPHKFDHRPAVERVLDASGSPRNRAT